MGTRIPAGLLLAAGGAMSAAASAFASTPAASAPVIAPVIAPLFPATVPATTAASPLPSNTVIELELLDPLSSETSHKGDFFKLRVVQPVVVEGEERVPAGSIAVGQIVHAAKSGMGGKGGELLLAARYLDLPSGQVKLRSTFGAAGQGHVVASLIVAEFFGPFGLAVHGKHLDLPAGTRIAARVAPLTPTVAAPPAPATDAPVSAAPASP
jgi:hypothetical protein